MKHHHRVPSHAVNVSLGLPLYLRLLGVALLHTWVVLGIGLLVAPAYIGAGWLAFLGPDVRERLQSIGEVVAEGIGGVLNQDWNVDLQRFDNLYGVRFTVYDGSARRIAGWEVDPPKEVLQELRRTTAIVTAPSSASAPASNEVTLQLPGWPRPDRELLKQSMFVLHSDLGARYWLGIRTAVELSTGDLAPITVIASTQSFWRFVRLLNLRRWVDLVVGVSFLSLLLWAPLAWPLTRDARRLITAANRIADGQFDQQLRLRRKDEIGSLSRALARVTERLNNFVESQKHFLANIAHEVNSPLGRLRLSLAILRDETETAESRAAFEDVDREMNIVAGLVNELLAFSRVGIGDRSPPMTTVTLYALVLSVLEREKDAPEKILLSIPVHLQVHTHPGLLARAIGNLVRNALRYAGTANGPIEIVAESGPKTVRVRVLDRGPGVPELALLKLGDPFYRPEHARRRETGGIGLGLATVRNCVAACGGRISFRNRECGGFEAELVLPLALV